MCSLRLYRHRFRPLRGITKASAADVSDVQPGDRADRFTAEFRPPFRGPSSPAFDLRGEERFS